MSTAIAGGRFMHALIGNAPFVLVSRSANSTLYKTCLFNSHSGTLSEKRGVPGCIAIVPFILKRK